MPNILELAKLQGLARYSLAESRVSVLPAGVNGVVAAKAHYGVLSTRYVGELAILDALRKRLELRPDPPPPRTLADAVCAACHRLEDLRQADRRVVFDGRKNVVGKVLLALDS